MTNFRDKIQTCGHYLISKRNPHDGGWALNIEKVFQSSSIVNTAEALLTIRVGNLQLNSPNQTIDFLKESIVEHPNTRGDNLRYYLFGILGLLYAGVSQDDSVVIDASQLIERRVINGMGWAEHREDDDIRTWQTFLSMWVLSEVFGKEYVAKKYRECINNIIEVGGDACFWGWGLEKGSKPSLAGTSFMLNILSLFVPDTPTLPKVRSNVITMLDKAIDNEEQLEFEAISGANWNHYSYCWALRAIHTCPISLDENGYWTTLKTLKYINSLFDGKGFREPKSQICNVRSVFNNAMAIAAIIEGFDPELYMLTSELLT